MCHHVDVRLSAEDKAAVKQVWRWLAPVYAVAVLALIAGVAVSGALRNGEQVASAASSAQR
jgi:hypothetical protein